VRSFKTCTLIVMKGRRIIRRTGRIAYTKYEKFIQFLTGKRERKRILGTPRRRWEDVIKINSKHTGC
jgi:hypothetical protein